MASFWLVQTIQIAKNIQPLTKEIGKCPKCGKPVLERKSKKEKHSMAVQDILIATLFHGKFQQNINAQNVVNI